jgi:protein phosphatase
MHRLTVDHTVVQELLDREMITASEAWNHPQAMVVTRSLGQRLAVEIELEEIPLAVGDTLLLCSGGLWRPVPEKEIQAAAESETAEAAAHNLLALALSADGKKSVGLEIARMIPPPDARHEERPPIALGALLTIFLLSLGCLCALVWFVWFVFKSN